MYGRARPVGANQIVHTGQWSSAVRGPRPRPAPSIFRRRATACLDTGVLIEAYSSSEALQKQAPHMQQQPTVLGAVVSRALVMPRVMRVTDAVCSGVLIVVSGMSTLLQAAAHGCSIVIMTAARDPVACVPLPRWCAARIAQLKVTALLPDVIITSQIRHVQAISVRGSTPRPAPSKAQRRATRPQSRLRVHRRRRGRGDRRAGSTRGC